MKRNKQKLSGVPDYSTDISKLLLTNLNICILVKYEYGLKSNNNPLTGVLRGFFLSQQQTLSWHCREDIWRKLTAHCQPRIVRNPKSQKLQHVFCYPDGL